MPVTIELHDVVRRYRMGEETIQALDRVSVTIDAGEFVAVTGPSGSGKSTLLALLLGFLEAERGAASIPGRVAWCPQEPQLMSTTVRENLRVGDPAADDARLAEALGRPFECLGCLPAVLRALGPRRPVERVGGLGNGSSRGGL